MESSGCNSELEKGPEPTNVRDVAESPARRVLDPATTAPSGDHRKWGDIPHPIALTVMVSSVVVAVCSAITAFLNYQEARRNNLLPPAISITGYLAIPPHGLESGEFEITATNVGRTPAFDLKIRRAMGIAWRPIISRGGRSDPERSAAYRDAVRYLKRSELIETVADLVEPEGFGRRPAFVETPGALQ